VQVPGDEHLRTIARELVKMVRANVTTRWIVRENVPADLLEQAELYRLHARITLRVCYQVRFM
jgi:hypothetical protein